MGDVYLSGIPMINQGQTAYCAVASAARVLQNYGTPCGGCRANISDDLVRGFGAPR